MVYATAGQVVRSELDHGQSGLAATLRFYYRRDGTNTFPTSGTITEDPAGSGLYEITAPVPSVVGTYERLWDTGPGTRAYRDDDDLVVGSAPAPPVMGIGADATYASAAALTSYTDAQLPDGEDAVRELLERAERDVDRLLGRYEVLATGRKLDPATLTAAQREALSRATCAAAEYRLLMGPQFFVAGQFERSAGPDFSSVGALPREAPKALEELAGFGLLADRFTVSPVST